MTDNKSKEKLYLPISLISWAVSFFFLVIIANKISFLSPNLATFLSATLLVALSVFVVFGFSKLNLHRTTYLAIGAIGLIGVYLTATPLVSRTKTISKVCNPISETFFITINTSVTALETEKLNAPTRNALFSENRNFLEDLIPESKYLILLLALFQLTLASGIGMWIGKGIDDISHLIPIAIVATLADIWSVSAGATSLIIVSSHIHYFLLRFPIIGIGKIAFLIGLTDFLFFAIFFQASVRYNLGIIKNTALLCLSFLIAVASALWAEKGLPVLPFMAILFVAGNYKNLKLKKEEIKQIILFLLAIGIVFSIFTFVFK